MTPLLRRGALRLLAGLLLAGAAQADVFTLGNVAVTVPAPAGFSNPAAQAPALAEALDQFAAPGTVQLGSFVSNADIAAVRRGQQPRLERYFLVQARKQDAAARFSKAQFEELRRVLREQNTEVLRGASSQLEAALQAMRGQGGPRVLPRGSATVEIYRDAPDGFGMLVLMNFDEGNSGRNVVLGGITTTTVRDKLVYLYAYSPLRTSADVHWVRTQSLAWLKAVQAANAS